MACSQTRVLRVDPLVDLRGGDVDLSDLESAGLPAFAWCCEFVRRFVAGADERVRLRVVGDTIKGPDRTRGADHDQLLALLGALDRGRPVAMSCWWPSGAPTTCDILGVDTIDVPPPSRKSTSLSDDHAVVALGYGRHDAFPGGGYIVIMEPRTDGAALPSTAAIRAMPFTYVRAYAIALSSAHVVGGPPGRSVGPVDPGRSADVPARLPIGPSRHPVDVRIARRARCADPRSSYTSLFFSENAVDTARAKAICARCDVRDLCLARALERAEPYGVWGGEFLVDGAIVVAKRGRGRPRRIALPADVDEVTGLPVPVVA